MGKKSRSKAASKQSITAHPLFPATVALWFGALFGLGSLAIRPTLLESIVLKFQLDAIVPMLAPPLGATTRILLALLMAGGGGVLGAMLARRLARPKPVERERKRSAASVRAAMKASRLKLSPQRKASRDDETRSEADSMLAPRRRALALDPDEGYDPAIADAAPLPGGSPGILDVSEFDLDGFESEDADGELELAQDWPAGEPSSAPDFAVQTESTAMDQFTPRSLTEHDSPGPSSPPEGAQVFAPDPEYAGHSQQSAATATDMAADPGFGAAFQSGADNAPPVDRLREQGGFGIQPLAAEPAQHLNVPQAMPADQPRLPRLELVDPGDDDADVQDARSIFDTSPGRPLFEQASAAAAPSMPGEAIAASAAPGFGSEETGFGGTPIADTDGFWGNAPDQAEPSSPEATDESLPPMPQAFGQPVSPPPAIEPEAPARVDTGSAAERISATALGALSNLELLERLALSLKRRSDAPASEAAAVPAAYVVQSAPEPTPEPAPSEPPMSAPSPAIPQAYEPVAAAPEPLASPAAAEMPAAMRPIGITIDFDDGEDDLLPSYIPPRNIATPAPSEPVPAQAPAVPEAYVPEPAQPAQTLGVQDDEDYVSDEDQRALDQGYSSLLNLSRPAADRQEFVRIEEPDHAGRGVEPVVIFPGQEARSAANGTAGSAAIPQGFGASPAADPAPSPVGSDAGLAANQSGASQPDMAESERALRAALATLQRMSGTA